MSPDFAPCSEQWSSRMFVYYFPMCPSIHSLRNSELSSRWKWIFYLDLEKSSNDWIKLMRLKGTWDVAFLRMPYFKMWWLADGSLLYLSTAHYRHLADYFRQCYGSNRKKTSVPGLSASQTTNWTQNLFHLLLFSFIIPYWTQQVYLKTILTWAYVHWDS